MKEPWSIKSRTRQCSVTGKTFEPGQKIRTAIFPDSESSGYVRKDFALDSWDSREESELPFSSWITRYEAAVIEEKAEDVVDQDPESLLQKMVEDDDAQTENVRYILAVMLERKKILRETDTQEVPSGILRVYEQRKTGDVYVIKDPQIPLSDVDKVQTEVREMLDPTPLAEAETPEGEASHKTSNGVGHEVGNKLTEGEEGSC